MSGSGASAVCEVEGGVNADERETPALGAGGGGDVSEGALFYDSCSPLPPMYTKERRVNREWVKYYQNKTSKAAVEWAARLKAARERSLRLKDRLFHDIGLHHYRNNSRGGGGEGGSYSRDNNTENRTRAPTRPSEGMNSHSPSPVTNTNSKSADSLRESRGGERKPQSQVGGRSKPTSTKKGVSSKGKSTNKSRPVTAVTAATQRGLMVAVQALLSSSPYQNRDSEVFAAAKSLHPSLMSGKRPCTAGVEMGSGATLPLPCPLTLTGSSSRKSHVTDGGKGGDTQEVETGSDSSLAPKESSPTKSDGNRAARPVTRAKEVRPVTSTKGRVSTTQNPKRVIVISPSFPRPRTAIQPACGSHSSSISVVNASSSQGTGRSSTVKGNKDREDDRDFASANSSESQAGVGPGGGIAEMEWECPKCNFENKDSSPYCSLCGLTGKGVERRRAVE